MTCHNCDPDLNRPGKLIMVDVFGPDMVCTVCGDRISTKMEKIIMENSINKCKELDASIYASGERDYFIDRTRRWDTYYYSICKAVATKSPCLSRQIGSILVRDKIIVATGFNGPPRGYPHCSGVRAGYPEDGYIECPRRAKGYKSGEGLHECPATHAEANCIASAARIGASVSGSTLYLNCVIPCKDCMALIINAGIKEVVCEVAKPYHYMSLEMAKHANIKIREFVL